MTMHSNLRGYLGIGLGALLVIGCTGDDGTTGASTSDSSTGGSDSTTTSATNTTPGTASATSSTSGTMSGTESAGETTGSTGGTESTTSPTSGTDTTGGGVCGDGNLDAGEECDDGDANGTARSMCEADCTVKQQGVCGDGNVDVGEECDDGNTDPGDGCDASCVIEPMDPVCGNGILEDGEACDDGNNVDDDGCQADCTETPPGECGNGVQEWDEQCDDGNLKNGDGCEDDCTPTPLPACLAPEDYISCDGSLNKNDPLAPFQALGLACSDKNSESILISDTQFNSPDATAWQIAKGFGSYIDPMTNELLYSAREGESFVIMSSGKVSAPNGQGVVTEPNGSQTGYGSNQNPDDNAFLPNYTPADDQSGVLLPQWQKGNSNPGDKIWFSFKTVTPTGTKGYAIDFAFFSSEWPTWVNTTYNDLFVAWQVHEDFTGNISTIGDLPTTITALHPHWTSKPIAGSKTCANFGSDGPGFSCNEPQLQGTGFEGHAGTTWVRINQPFDGMDDDNKDLELYFFLADMGDTVLATGVLVDRFRWACDECIPAEDPKCTGEVPDPNCCGVVLPM
ncbi:MAG: DUF4215 domain-containing protein [Myxococcales bacterium]|nr:DUF4215 domain-containing protein [Myxococcales bacterium]MCB9705272.1 DUF4215 domain-containing protein [Myxococcales bacterium]